MTSDGYLMDPVGAPSWQTSLIATETLAEKPCVVVLGEPGIGKTTTLQSEQDRLAALEQSGEARSLTVDLGACGSEQRVREKVFNSAEYRLWLAGTSTLRLFLDGVDECGLKAKVLASLLDDGIPVAAAPRLRLRVACRTAEWPALLEVTLKRLFGQDNVSVYELAPLRRSDVALACTSHGVDAEAFHAALVAINAVPLAIKPLTLQFLINRYKVDGKIAATQGELYEDGLSRLCEEDPSRLQPSTYGHRLSPARLLAVASRIAALTAFTNKSGILKGIDDGEAALELLRISEVVGEEAGDDGQFEVNEAAIKQALNTGIFSARGAAAMGWSHLTYGEFLAARYVVKHNLRLRQLRSLVVSPWDQRIVPQLRGTVACLAAMRGDVFALVLATDPSVLLGSDGTTRSPRQNEDLTQALLDMSDEDRSVYLSDTPDSLYSRLDHPGLQSQLSPYIGSTTESPSRRELAISIATVCGLDTLFAAIATVAQNSAESLRVRVTAAQMLSTTRHEARRQLRPLGLNAVPEDTQDELKGFALKALWPDYITPQELLASLTPPKDESLLGSYKWFLLDELASTLRSEDLSLALNHLARHANEHLSSLQSLCDTVARLAWDRLAEPEIMGAFAPFAAARLAEHDYLFDHTFHSQTDLPPLEPIVRRQLVLAVLAAMQNPADECYGIMSSRGRLVGPEDVPWLIAQLTPLKDQGQRAAVVNLVRHLFDPNIDDHRESLLVAVAVGPRVETDLGSFVHAVDLSSPEATEMRAAHAKRLALQAAMAATSSRPAAPSPQGQVAELLAKFEQGDLAAWWRLNLVMMSEDAGGRRPSELEPDLRLTIGWKDANEETRNRVVRAANRYVHNASASTDTWLGTNTFHRPAAAGYRALRLLQGEAVSLLPTQANAWKEWAPIVLAYPLTSTDYKEQAVADLVRLAYKGAPDEFLRALDILIDRDDREYHSLFVLERVKPCLDARLQEFLLAKVRGGKLGPESTGSLLAVLLDNGNSAARQHAEESLVAADLEAPTERARWVGLARVMANHTPDSSWELIWPLLNVSTAFGYDLATSLARDSKVVGHLDTEQLGELFIWLSSHFPQHEDPTFEGTGAHMVGPREEVAMWRDGVLNRLVALGTPDACEAIENAMLALPHLPWLSRALETVRLKTRENTWACPTPSQFHRLVRDARTRLVSSLADLMETLAESIEGLNKRLQEDGEVQVLWRKDGTSVKARWKPKDEDALADWIKWRLVDDVSKTGIVLNREVKIRRGQFTDIHVDAIVPSDASIRTISAVIEIKGCWHQELKTAARTQLVDRYLAGTSHGGLYVVGWFRCSRWTDKDSRKRRAPSWSLAKAGSWFKRQAKGLSTSDRPVSALVLDTALRD